jgi:hypothetical protein
MANIGQNSDIKANKAFGFKGTNENSKDDWK